MEGGELLRIGKGSGSRVWLYRKSGQSLCLKMVSSVHTKESQLLRNEFILLQRLQHPYILQAYELRQIGGNERNKQITSIKQPQTVLIAEFANRGSLLSLLEKNRPKSIVLLNYFRQISQALEYTHSVSVAHRDIKLDNILLFAQRGNIVAKLGDFGLASLCFEEGQPKRFKEIRGSELYMAPQIWEVKKNPDSSYDAIKTDIFALGVVLFAMIFGKMPFSKTCHPDSLWNRLDSSQNDEFWQKQGVSSTLQAMPQEQATAFKSLFEAMVHRQPSKRPSATEILSNPFLSKYF